MCFYICLFDFYLIDTSKIVLYVRGELHGLGADAREEKMSSDDLNAVAMLLKEAGFSHNPKEFKRIASAKSLYHWNADAHQEY